MRSKSSTHCGVLRSSRSLSSLRAGAAPTGMPTIFYTLMLLLACCSASSTKALVWTSLGGHVSLSLAAVKVLLRILTRAPWGSFHVRTPMAHCAAVNKLKGEGGLLLHPSWPASGTCGHLFCNIRRQCQQGAVPWQTAIDRKQKKEEVQEQVIAADASQPNLMLPRRSSARSMQKPVRCFICTGWHAPVWRRQRCLEMFGETFITGLKKTSYIGLRLQRVEH